MMSEEKEEVKNDYPSRAKVVETPAEDPTSPAEQRDPNEPSIVSSEQTEKPPSILETPFLVEMLEIGEAKDHFEMPALIKEINEFVLSEFERLKLEDTSDSYKEIVEKYTKKLPENLDNYALVERLVDLVKIDKKLIEAMKEKDRIMNADIIELSSSQLRKRIEHGTTNN